MTQGQRPTTPPPFPTPAQLSQQKAAADDPAVVALMWRVHEAFERQPTARGEYTVYKQAQDTESVVATVAEQLAQQGWEIQCRSGVLNDADLIITAKQ